MGEYRLSIYLKWQITIGVAYDYQIVIYLPFVDIRISTRKDAGGTNFWNFKLEKDETGN